MPWQNEELFAKSDSIQITINKNHELVRLSDQAPWREMIQIAMTRRAKSRAILSGPEPMYRQLLGAVVLMSVKNLQYRDVEDLIMNYAPARYLCDLLDSDWTPDHTTIFLFMKMLGKDGIDAINQRILQIAIDCGIADPSVLMSDTTAQEARIPYPNEAGLMNRFMTLVGRSVRGLRGRFDGAKKKIAKAISTSKGLLRNAHLFAKGREAKVKIEKKMYHTVKSIQKTLEVLISQGANIHSKAGQELQQINQVMKKLLPQIYHFLDTGFVAAKKIIHLQIPELYAIVRGKAGKSVEFGIKWGISRIGGGFVTGFLLGDGRHGNDSRFCRESLKVHKAMFGKAPRVFGFDRGGDSDQNINFAKKMGIKHIGIAPRGKRPWPVGSRMQDKIRRERAQVEGSIGTIKSSRYGFNKPRARSKAAMLSCGYRAIFGFNLRKMVIMTADAARV